MNLKCEKSFKRYVNVRVCPLAAGSIALKIRFFISYVFKIALLELKNHYPCPFFKAQHF